MANLCILVVDDRERTVKAVARVLQKAGYEVVTALSGADGLRKALDAQPDLIILDVMMPGMDGYQVCHRLKNQPTTEHIPVLMLTGKGRLDDLSRGQAEGAVVRRIQEQIQGFDSGAVEFLTKPIHAQELIKRVKALLWLSGLEA
jgi:DNA-binding response OmpR family regulator